ncbi:alpha/beta hydrolase fold domain-containing protein [Oligoflexaceae bacterium]|nr:alpha/beta hydrolase fold domain-containing protein [Oligoflexaceae bacterium]
MNILKYFFINLSWRKALIGCAAISTAYYVVANKNKKKSEQYVSRARSKIEGNHEIKGHKKYQAPTYQNIAYGPQKRQNLNLWINKNSHSTPLLVHIHGGAFATGSKKIKVRRSWVNAGLSYASIDYRFATGGKIKDTLNDVSRAIQFLRLNAAKWNLNRDAIFVHGESAGGTAALWLAFHDDMAQPTSNDPVLRVSSRVSGAIAVGAQTTFNPRTIARRLGWPVLVRHMFWDSFGAKNSSNILYRYARYNKLIQFADPVQHIDNDDPPVLLKYKDIKPTPVTNGKDGIHNIEFGRILIEKCIEKKAKCTLQNTSIHKSTSEIEFIRKTIEAVDLSKLVELPKVRGGR